MARRPRRAAVLLPADTADAASGAIFAADSDELDDILVREVMGAAAKVSIGAMRERERQLWAQGYTRVAGAEQPTLIMHCGYSGQCPHSPDAWTAMAIPCVLCAGNL